METRLLAPMGKTVQLLLMQIHALAGCHAIPCQWHAPGSSPKRWSVTKTIKNRICKNDGLGCVMFRVVSSDVEKRLAWSESKLFDLVI